MKKTEFFEHLLEALEPEEEISLDQDTDLREVEEYDSLTVLSIIAMTDEHFGVTLSAQDFKEITTVQSLMDLIGADQFE